MYQEKIEYNCCFNLNHIRIIAAISINDLWNIPENL